MACLKLLEADSSADNEDKVVEFCVMRQQEKLGGF